jgi:uncharacterized protein (TIGR00251 family)
MPNCIVHIRVTPRAGKSQIVGWQSDVLLVRVAAPPVQGSANKAVIELLSESFGIRKSAIVLQAGESSRNKRIALDGISCEEVRAVVARCAKAK